MKSEQKEEKLAVVIESRACESRACVNVYWCADTASICKYCNTHEHKARVDVDVESEESVSKRKGMEHGQCKKHYGKKGRDATWSDPPHAQCSTRNTIAAAGLGALPARGRVCSISELTEVRLRDVVVSFN